LSAVSETIVREYFELHGFFVRQQRKYIATSRREDDEIDFLVVHPRQQAAAQLPFELGSADLAGVARAVVVVKGWHTDTFSPGLLANAPEIFRFLEPAVFAPAAKAFGGDATPLKILIVPALPSGAEAHAQSIAMLQAKGVDAVIPFRTMLGDLIEQIEVNRNYQKSDLLQVIRILKNYDFFRGPQLELFKARRQRGASKPNHSG
jgi:hypothetical protein